jgi:hypothetical protein
MTADDREIAWLLAYQRGLLTRTQSLSCGLTEQGLRHRYRAGGPWQRLLPGIYLTVAGQPTREQIETAALLYAGPARGRCAASRTASFGTSPQRCELPGRPLVSSPSRQQPKC